MIDLHSHLLPAVDDGSRSVVQSVKVMKEQVARGVTDICLTPHVRAGDLAKTPPEAHETAYNSLVAAAPPLPRLHRGAEVMLDRPLPPNPAHVRRFTIGGTRSQVTPAALATPTRTLAASAAATPAGPPEPDATCAHTTADSATTPDTDDRSRRSSASGACEVRTAS